MFLLVGPVYFTTEEETVFLCIHENRRDRVEALASGFSCVVDEIKELPACIHAQVTAIGQNDYVLFGILCVSGKCNLKCLHVYANWSCRKQGCSCLMYSVACLFVLLFGCLACCLVCVLCVCVCVLVLVCVCVCVCG